ncbi:hypothetical protein CLOM_g18123, partial [Closterium sp. NIES-68]
VRVPCHILQSSKDLAVPVMVSEYMHLHLGGKSVVEIFPHARPLAAALHP